MAAHLATLSASHADHVQRLARVHEGFLAQRARLAEVALGARTVASPWVAERLPTPVPRPPSQVPAPAVATSAAGTAAVVAPAAAPPAAVPPAAVPPAATSVPAVQAAPPARAAWPSAEDLPGPKLDRAGLEVHASGLLSTILGPSFADQDGFHRQVRMPEPPLLLADRLLGIDAPDHVLGKGVLWTETDVGSQSWYLHEGRMPAGILIESGQADLLLISWMGIDRFNRSERAYRLLGCELTYEGPLPEAGTTLRYTIHVDGHATHDGIRLFFFHYDCVDDQGRPILTVRGGQAGFFTEGELADSAGVLWSPETGEHDQAARLDPPAVACTRTSLTRAQLEAFAAGDAFACFGAGFERAASHVATPRIQAAPMLLLHRVDVLDATGGPWGRGYLRASWDVRADDWFFEGHFKNDPCMPGTLMFEGCLQALAIHLTSLGYTIPRDGWRFEPVPGEPIPMRCRGQVLPTARELIYEVFVEEVHEGPVPVVYADLLCTVDGLKAFHARRCGLRLAPHWPLDDKLGAADLADPPGARIAVVDGFAFDKRAMLACAWGRPSEAFGPMYAPFDGSRRVPRLPSPPYHFVSRVEEVDGPIGGMKAGTRCVLAYDVPPDAWYFEDGGTGAMPYAVLLEVALQPCGWLASYVGCALTSEGELFFRNLDGTGVLHREVRPDVGTIVTDVTLTKLSQSGGMIIVAFEVRCTDAQGTPIWTMDTVFGFFPAAALDAQRGLGKDAAAEAAWAEPSERVIPLDEDPVWRTGSARLGTGRLALLDRLTGLWPDGGRAGLGRARGRMDVHPRLWFFSAHFFQDPVQPGSLGLEAIEQALRALLIAKGLAAEGQRFESLAVEVPVTWRYRGQVRPFNTQMDAVVDLVELREEPDGLVAVAEADLWCDGLRIYHTSGLALRVVRDPGPRPGLTRTVSLTREPWLTDHRPTWTLPAIPMMDLAAWILAEVPDAVGVEGLELARWLTVDPELTLALEVEGDAVQVLADGRLAARGRLLRDPGSVGGWPALTLAPVADPYEDGSLFHGPAYRLVRGLVRGAEGSEAWLDLDALTVPPRARLGVVLDALTHLVPHDDLSGWNAALGTERAAYPLRLDRLVLHGPLPVSGRLRARARFDGMVDPRRPAVRLQLVADDVVVVEARLVEILVPKGPVGRAARGARLTFLRDRRFAAGVALSSVEGEETVLRAADVAASDWLPGTVAALYGASPDRLEELAVKDHAARLLEVHPGTVRVVGTRATSPRAPMSVVDVEAVAAGGVVRVRGGARLDLTHLEEAWRGWFGIGAWPVEDLYYSLLERFVRRVHTPEPEALEAVRGRPVVYLANHQTMIESLLFSILAGGLLDLPVCTVAKDEHRTSWLGRLIRQSFAWPGVTDPRVIAFLDRGDKSALLTLLAELKGDLEEGRRSIMIHVEGTRAHSSREPVVKLSGAVLDVAIASGVPVVPVRFVGGLPSSPLAERTDYPVGLGAQDVWIGAPILPETLAADGLRDRKQRVVDAIEALGPPRAQEEALSGDAELEALVAALLGDGRSRSLTVACEVLRRSRRRASPWTERLLGAVEGGTVSGRGPEAAWVRDLAALLTSADEG